MCAHLAIIGKGIYLNQVFKAADLVGQAPPPAVPARPRAVKPPKLDVAWGSFHQGIGSSLRVIFSRSRVSKSFLSAGSGFFKECWIERRIPRRALVAAALWHFVFILMPFPQLPASARRASQFDNTELTWSGPISDFPLLDMKTPKAKPSPRGEAAKPLPPEGADAFHPRQRIITDPVHPTHPRQTLINSSAPPEPPKILPNLPNIVQFQQAAGPARPRLQISQETLSKLRPRELRKVKFTAAPAPDLLTLDQKLADIAPSMLPNAPARPKLELNAGAAPRVAPRTQAGDAEPAPEVAATQSGVENGNASTFIALSATPGPPAPVAPPQGNLAARVSISPEGKSGATGGSPSALPPANGGIGGAPGSGGGTDSGAGNGKNGMDVSISGGHPSANNGISGSGGPLKLIAPAAHALIVKPDARAKADDRPQRIEPPNFAALPPSAQPEQIFAAKKVYKMLVNMPNLNSATGSWILNFSELSASTQGPHLASSDVSAPGPVRKVDPKYPPTLIKEHVEGEVVLYAVIRSDGSVDSIQLVRGIDEQLDANAMQALSQWKFRPATKQGVPVDLEAIVHIPFHAPPDR
jgi:TonB family protein